MFFASTFCPATFCSCCTSAKRSCIDAAVQRMIEVQQEQKVAGQKVEAKNMLIHQSCEKLGLHPATKPTGSMIDSTLYFNWRQQGRGSRSPIAQEKCEALLHGTFTLDKSLLELMSGAMLSEANCAFLNMMVRLA